MRLDLASDQAWLGLRPGMTRSEVLAVADAAGVYHDPNSDDLTWDLLEDDWGIELRFGRSAPHVLLQLVREDDDLTWRGKPVMGVPVHEAVQNLEIAPEETAWQPEDASADPMDGSIPNRSGPFSDAFLLSECTLWLPQRGLGLVLLDGLVSDVVWRRAQDLPAKFEGPLTQAQMEWSKRSDLYESLSGALRKTELELQPVAQSWSALQWLLCLAYVVCMGSLIRNGVADQQRWQQAPVLTGHLTALESLPGGRGEMAYHISYDDPVTGKRYEAVLERGDFYVQPREVGDPAQIHFLPGDPPEVKGLPFARDHVFLYCVPRGIALTIAYMIANGLAGWWALRRKRVMGPVPESMPSAAGGKGLPTVKRF